MSALSFIRSLACGSVLGLMSVAHAQAGGSSADSDRVSARIISGTKAPQGAYPWTVALLAARVDKAVDAHFCGGTLVAPQWVATAAHCVADVNNPEEIEVLVGQTKLSGSGGVRVPVRGIVVHPQYDGGVRNDFALIKLDFPVAYTPIELASPFSSSLYSAGRPAKVVGWGQTNPEWPVLPDDLQEATVPLVDPEQCNNANGRLVDPAMMICAGELPAPGDTTLKPDSCYGDSGGPLFVTVNNQPIQVGMVSWGFECSSRTTYGVYSKVSSGHEFLISRPVIAPRASSGQSDITLTGLPRVGETVEAPVITWAGDAPTSVTYEWWVSSSPDGSDMKLAAATASNSFVLTPQFANKYASVVITASNQGGEAYISSSQILVAPAEISPTPPPPGPTTADQSAPTVVKAGKEYKGRTAYAFFSVSDGENSSGISLVTGDLKVKLPRRSGKGTRIVTDQITAVSVGGNLYRLEIKRVKRARYELTVTAKDGAGFTSAPVKLSLKRY